MLIVGGGAAGVACAWSLCRHGAHEVHLWEASKHLGGVATTARLPDGRLINDQVQGGAYTYHNLLAMLDACGISVSPVKFRVCFGQGSEQWTNYRGIARVIRECADDVKRFGEMLPRVGALRGVFTTISEFMRKYKFSQRFQDQVVIPLVSLFLGTGDQARNVPVSVVSKMFFNPTMKLFDYSPSGFLRTEPTMFAFPPLRAMYQTIRRCGLRDPKVSLGRRVRSVVRSGGKVRATDADGRTATFDRIVFACSAESTLGVLKDLTWAERMLLPQVKYFSDLAVTHTDANYVRVAADAGIEMSFDLGTCSTARSACTRRTSLTGTGGASSGPWTRSPRTRS